MNYLTQLKTLGESLTVLNSINGILGRLDDGTLTYKQSLYGLTGVTALYSTETVKAALAQSTLNEEQIRTILSSKRLEGQELETATAEIIEAQSTRKNTIEKEKNIGVTTRWKYALKGLGDTLKRHAALTSTIGMIAVVYGGIKLYEALTESAEEASERLENNIEKATSEYEEISSDIDEINSRLEENKARIEEINKLDSPTYVEQEELEKLKQVNSYLENNKKLLEESKKASAQESVSAIYEKFETDFYTNKTKTINDVADSKLEKFAGKIPIAKQIVEYIVTETDEYNTDFDNFDNLIKELNKYNSLKNDLLSSGKDEIVGESFLGQPEIYSYEKLDTLIEQYTKNINKYKTDILQVLNEISEYDPNFETEEAKKLISLLDSIEASIDIDSFGKNITNRIVESSDFSEISKSISEKVKSGFNLTYEDLIADEEYSKLVKEIAEQMLKASGKYQSSGLSSLLGDEVSLEYQLKNSNYMEKAASYLISSFEEEIEQQVGASSPLKMYLNSADNAEIKKELLDLAKSGEITPETLSSTEEYNAILTELQITAEDATNQILDMLTAQEKLSGISQGLDKLKSAYEEFKDEYIGFVTAETLESLPDVFKNLPEFDLFSKIVGDPTRVNEMQEAFDDLVSAYIRDQRLFTDIANASETEINSIIANLEQMGVTNAKEVVNTAKTEYAKATELIKDAEKEYANYLDNKDGFNEEFINSTLSKNGQMINSLSEEYQTDYDNWCELLKKKSEALNEFINAIKSSGLYGDTDSVLSNYSTRTDEEAYKTAKKILDEYNQAQNNNQGLLGSFGNSDFSLRNDDLLNKDVIENARKTVAAYESAQKLSEKLSFNLSNVSVDFSSALDFEPSSDKDKSSSSKDKDPEDFDWIETKLNNTSDYLDKLKDKVNDTYSTWENRNKSLRKAIADTQNAINLQAQAEATYLAKANSITLPEYLKSRVRLGDMSIQDNVDENTSKLINEYKEWYDKAKACKDAQDELNNSLNELKSTQFFELINNEYDALYAKLDNSLDVLQSKIDKAELQGLFANESYYTSMIGYTQAKINNLEKERKQLQAILNSSGIRSDTEAWNEMYQTLMDTDSEIRDLENQIIEFNNNIRDLNWEIFDYLEESISRITDETEYLNNLIKESDLFDDKGKFTEYADASIGLHTSTYDVYMQQAEDYYEEVQELQKQLLNGAGKDVLERYNEMVDAHQDSILAAQDEKKAILDLVENGYQKQLDYLNEIIDKKKESLNAEKDLYDYQKSIEEKTSNIASLKKQEKAFLNDDSEYGMSQLQKIQLELSNAEKDLEQTEREQFLQDSQKMLDELTTDYEDWMNARLDDEDALLKEIVSGISEKGDEINDTLQTLAKENNTFISDTITSIFDADNPFTSELSGIKANTAGTTNAINALINTVAGIVGTNNKGNAGSNGSNTSNPSKDTSKSPSTPSVNNTPSNNNANKNVSNNTSKGEYDSIFIHKKYSPQKLNRETSLVDRLKSDNIDASWEARAKYWSKIFGGAYTGSDSQNIKFLNWLKANGYKNGTLSASKGLHLFDEEGLGSEIIITKEGALRQFNAGDTVFSDKMVDNLWNLAQNNPISYNLPKTPDMSNLVRKDNNNSFNMGDINIEMHEVNDAKGLMDDITNNLIKNRRFENAMCTMINNKIMGKNPTEHYKYIK